MYMPAHHAHFLMLHWAWCGKLRYHVRDNNSELVPGKISSENVTKENLVGLSVGSSYLAADLVDINAKNHRYLTFEAPKLLKQLHSDDFQR